MRNYFQGDKHRMGFANNANDGRTLLDRLLGILDLKDATLGGAE